MKKVGVIHSAGLYWNDVPLCGIRSRRITRKAERIQCKICLKIIKQMKEDEDQRKRKASEGAAALRAAYPTIF